MFDYCAVYLHHEGSKRILSLNFSILSHAVSSSMRLTPLIILLYHLGIFAVLLPAATSTKLCVIPNDRSPCPCHNCHTFDFYLNHSDTYFVSNTTFLILPGTHLVHQAYNGNGVSGLNFTGINATLEITNSTNSVWFGLSDSNEVSFNGLDIRVSDNQIYPLNISNTMAVNIISVSVQCTGNCVILIQNMINGTVHFHNFQTSPLISSDITTSVAVTLSNVSGLSNISNSSFGSGSELVFFYTSDTDPLPGHDAIILTNVQFFGMGFYESAFAVYIEGDRESVNAKIFSVSIENCSFTTRSTSDFGSSFVVFQVLDVMATNLSVQVYLKNLILSSGSGRAVVLDFESFGGIYEVYIQNCTFTNMHGSALLIWVGNNSLSDVVVENSVFSWNRGNSEAQEPLVALLNFGSQKNAASIIMKNVTVESNSFYSAPIGTLQNMLLYKLHDVTMINCSFKNNYGSALYLDTASVKMLEQNVFINNTGFVGAAICVEGESILRIFTNGSNVIFANNTAKHTGGAVQFFLSKNLVTFRFEQYSFDTCFIKVEGSLDHSCEGENCVFSFDNNMANDGGDDIHGGDLAHNKYCVRQNCSMTCLEVLKKFSNFKQKSLSQISSSPSRVCLCEKSYPVCLKYNTSISIFPGQTIHIPAFTVGQQFGTSRGSVFAQILNKSTSAFIPEVNRTQSVDIRNCSDNSNILQYNIENPQEHSVIVLTAEDTVVSETLNGTEIDSLIKEYQDYNGTHIPQMLLTLPVYINISLLKCPKGFELKNGVCDCSRVLMGHKGRYRVLCDIDTQEITREYSVWVNASNTTARYSQYCPLLYCSPSVVQVNLSREHGADVQCINHHSGVLCGGCQKGFSLAIGSSNCLPHCSNNYLWLLLIFATAGVLLVLLIKFLNLTITQGMISGLIFYANIVQGNKNALLNSSDPGVRVFATFIAWLNLDFGIETCFSEGLDMYTKTWLQFVFPLYLWILAGGMILVCRYSRLATKFFGDNTVHVLATIFLLSYNKLLITITMVYSSSTINVQNNYNESDDIKENVVWTYDGNVPFFSTRHSLLFAVSTGVLLFLWLPFTLCVLLGQWLQRYNHYRGLRWLARITPLLDAYYGPLKDSRRYWVGVLLLARSVVIVPAADPLGTRSSSLLTLSLLILVLLFFLAHVGRVYRKLYLSLVETSFFINIAVLAIVSLYIDDTDEAAEVVVYVSAAHCGLTLFLVLFFHLYQTLVKHKCQRPRKDRYVALHESNDVVPDIEYDR